MCTHTLSHIHTHTCIINLLRTREFSYIFLCLVILIYSPSFLLLFFSPPSYERFFLSLHTESVCFLLPLIRNQESHCLLPRNPPPAQGGFCEGAGSFLQPRPPAPSSLSTMPAVPTLCSSCALPSASTASDRVLFPPGLPPALACSSCSPGLSWVPPPSGGLPPAFCPWPLTGEQTGPH